MSTQFVNLATHYRPTDFSEIVGQDLAVEVLKKIALADGIAARSIVLKGAFGAGKCVHPDTIIKTDEGLRRAKYITKQTFNILGTPNSFVATEINNNEEVYVITTEAGRTLRVTNNHPIMVWDNCANIHSFINAEDVKVGQTVLADVTNHLTSNPSSHRIFLQRGVHFLSS